VTNAAATLTLPSAGFTVGAVYGGTLKIGNLYPETVTNLYVPKARLLFPRPPPTAPNLTISAFSATPTAVNVGAASTLAATVRNVGDSSSSATTLRYYYWTGSVWSEIAHLCNKRYLIGPRCNLDSIVRHYDAANRRRTSFGIPR
jgi:hypothetical protein